MPLAQQRYNTTTIEASSKQLNGTKKKNENRILTYHNYYEKQDRNTAQ